MRLFVFLISILFCIDVNSQNSLSIKESKPVELYRSKNLIILQLSDHCFLHTSFLETNDFGNVPCNGMFVKSGDEVIVFDTPTKNSSSDELIKFIRERMHCTIKAIVPTHFHDDCLGGLASFHKQNIPSFAHSLTIQLTASDNLVIPKKAFCDSLKLNIGHTYITVKYFGEGHTRDNVVGYFPKENILFGGCLIKELQATKGYLGHANVAEWSNTVEKVKNFYPNVRIVVPGHGKPGGVELLDYTIKLFRNN